MEMRNVPLTGIKVDPLAHELATSEGTRPYLDCVIKAHRNNVVGLEAALEAIRDLSLEKRYVWRVFSARSWHTCECSLPSLGKSHLHGHRRRTTAPFTRSGWRTAPCRVVAEGEPGCWRRIEKTGSRLAQHVARLVLLAGCAVASDS